MAYSRTSKSYNKKNITVTANKTLCSKTNIIRIIDTLINHNYIYHRKGNNIQRSTSTAYPGEYLQYDFRNIAEKINHKRIKSEDKRSLIKIKDGDKKRIYNIIDKDIIYPKHIKTKNQKNNYIQEQYNNITMLSDSLCECDIKLDKKYITDNYNQKLLNMYEHSNFIELIDNNQYILLEPMKMMYRVFNDSSFLKGGRLYHRIQRLKGNLRRNLTINDEKLSQIDISGSHIRMLYHIDDKECYIRDLYKVFYNDQMVKYKQEFIRGINKRIFQIIINTESRKQAEFAVYRMLRRAITADDIYNNKLSYFQSFDVVRQWLNKFEEKYHKISDYFYTVMGLYLQHIESEILINTMLELLNKHNTPSIPVHDELLVPESKQDIAINILFHKYKEYPDLNGKNVILKVKNS